MSTWIFLRGLTREARHWGDFVATFGAAIGDADVLTPDLPGNGHLYRRQSPLSVAAMAEYCRAELQARGIAPPYRLLAMSLGAMVAVAWAHEHPEEISACVLINTSLRPFSPFYRRLRPRAYPALLKLALRGTASEAWDEAILRLTSKRAGNSAGILSAWNAYRREYPVSRRNALRQLLAASRYCAPAAKPPVPVLVLAGAQDALVDPACSRRLAQCWQADFAEHPTAGHDLPLDDGAWVARQVRHWLRGM